MKLLISAAILAASIPAAATAQTFNFEGASTATVTSYSDTQAGLTLTLIRQGGKTFSFQDISGSGPVGFGSRTLNPFIDATVGAFVANFSAGLSAFQFQAGDFGADDDAITLSIYSGLNGTGTLLGTQTVNYGVASLPGAIANLSLTSATPFLSAVFNGGSAGFPNSVYYDNIVVRQAVAGVPEPATWAMMMLGFGAMGFAMRRRTGVTTRIRYA